MYFGLGYDVFGLKRFTKDELLRRTDYTYDAADRLTQVQRAARVGGTYNAKRATDSYTYDAAGNRISHTATPDGTLLYTDKTYFDALARITKGVSAQGRTTTMTYAWDATLKGAGGAAVGGWKKTTTNGTTTTTTYYAYEWWDSAKQSRITTQAYNPAQGVSIDKWGKGVSHYTYDVNGHLLGAIDEVGKQSFTYVNNAQGQVMLREQRDAGTLKQTHRYYYAEGKAVGDVGNDGDTNVDYATQLADTSSSGNTYTDRQNAYKNWRPVSSADFDQNYQAITASYPGTAPGSYVVQAGDSLYSIAASQWGDASLWYLIAEANGLSGASSLTAGQTLSIPNKVTNVHNSSSTSGVYDAGKTMGDTSPTIPDAPPPPQQDKGGCGALATIIVIAIAVVVTGGVAGAAITAMGGASAVGVAGTMAAWAVGGAVGSIASQGAAMAMGMQSEFSWKQVGVSALGAAVTAGLAKGAQGAATSAAAAGEAVPWYAGSNWVGTATRAAAASVVTQGMGSMLGVSSFSWRGVAAAAAGAGMSTAMSDAGWMSAVNPFQGETATQMFNGTAAGLVNGGVQAGIFDTKPNWGSIAAQSFGSALGDSFTQQKVSADQQSGSVSGGQGFRAGAGTASSWGPQYSFDDTGIGSPDYSLASADGPSRLGATNDAPSQSGTYRVARGDSVEGIARQNYGENWRAGVAAIMATNGIGKTDRYGNPIIRAGANLMLPDLGAISNDAASKLNRMGGEVIAANSRQSTSVHRAEQWAAEQATAAYAVQGAPADGSFAALSQSSGSMLASGSADQRIYAQMPGAGYVGGAAELVGAGVWNQVVKIGSGVASIPALLDSLDAAVAVQEGIQQRWSYTPRTEGAQAIANALVPVGAFFRDNVMEPTSSWSRATLGDGATTALGVGLQAGAEIAGLLGGVKGAQAVVEAGLRRSVGAGALDAAVVDRIVGTAKGLRPDPSTYLSKDYIDAHLAQFSDGVTKFSAHAPSRDVGPPGGTFVMPRALADSLVAESSGSVSALEKMLSVDPGALGARPVRIDISSPSGLRMPSGNELGANPQWVPGGFTKGGIPEATIDPARAGTYTTKLLF